MEMTTQSHDIRKTEGIETFLPFSIFETPKFKCCCLVEI